MTKPNSSADSADSDLRASTSTRSGQVLPREELWSGSGKGGALMMASMRSNWIVAIIAAAWVFAVSYSPLGYSACPGGFACSNPDVAGLAYGIVLVVPLAVYLLVLGWRTRHRAESPLPRMALWRGWMAVLGSTLGLAGTTLLQLSGSDEFGVDRFGVAVAFFVVFTVAGAIACPLLLALGSFLPGRRLGQR